MIKVLTDAGLQFIYTDSAFRVFCLFVEAVSNRYFSLVSKLVVFTVMTIHNRLYFYITLD